MPALERLPERINATRIVASAPALDAVAWPAGAVVLRVAPDEALVLAEVEPDGVWSLDPHAIVVAETGFVGVWLAPDEALDLLERACEWEPPTARPAFAQGMVAGLPLKIWFETDRALFITPAPFAADLEERFFDE